MPRKIRVMVGKPGLDGHDRGAKVVAAALRDAGMEVIYTGLHQSPEQIVEAALQEDVDVVALSILSGAHMTLFPEVLELMKKRGLGDRLLTGGGIIPPDDMETLAKLGVGRLFGPGTSTQDIALYIRDWFVGEHGEVLEALASPVATTSNSAPSATPSRIKAARKPEQRLRSKPRAKKAKPSARAKSATRSRPKARSKPRAGARRAGARRKSRR